MSCYGFGWNINICIEYGWLFGSSLGTYLIFKFTLYLWRILRTILSHICNSLVLHFKYCNFVQVKNTFLCFGRIPASILYFLTKVRRLFFAGDGRVIRFGGTWIESYYSIIVVWWSLHNNWIIRRYYTEDLNRRPILLVL